jgi:membrane-associated phospholipid phosphatase
VVRQTEPESGVIGRRTDKSRCFGVLRLIHYFRAMNARRSTIAVLLVSSIIISPGTAFCQSSSDDQGWSVGKVWKDTKSGVGLFLSDMGSVATKPARMSRDDYIWLGELLLFGGILFYYDEDIDRAVQQNKNSPLLSTIGDIGDTFEPLGLMGTTNRYYFGGVVLGYFTGWGPLQRISTDILFSHWIAGLYRSAFKVFVGRARPRADTGAYEFNFNTGTSLPSGHASTIMQLATILSRYADWWPASVVFYTIAGCVCYQRVESREHWASDVWVGAMSGAAIARLVMREHDDKGVIWVPSVDPVTNTYGIQVQFGF